LSPLPPARRLAILSSPRRIVSREEAFPFPRKVNGPSIFIARHSSLSSQLHERVLMCRVSFRVRQSGGSTGFLEDPAPAMKIEVTVQTPPKDVVSRHCTLTRSLDLANQVLRVVSSSGIFPPTRIYFSFFPCPTPPPGIRPPHKCSDRRQCRQTSAVALRSHVLFGQFFEFSKKYHLYFSFPLNP